MNNEKPYYSADRGFACAAMGRGVAEAVREHINVIIRNEELEIASDHGQIREKIGALRKQKDKLEQEKDSCQKEITGRETEIAEQEATLAELNAKLNAPAEAEVISTPNPRIEALQENKRRQEQELADKKVERGTLKVESKVPLTVEILKTMVDLIGIDTPKIGFSWKQFSVALGYTLSLIGLIFYVYVFYASVAAKAFSPDSPEKRELSVESRAQADESALNQYVDASAWHDAWKEDPPNLFVILFPMIFIGFVIVLHFCISSLLEGISQKSLNRWALGFLAFTLIFDSIIAINISRNIEDVKTDRIEERQAIVEAQMRRTGQRAEASVESTTNTDSSRTDLIFNIFAIIFLGFVPALLLTGSIYATLQSWSKVRPWGEYIKRKKHEYKVELAALDSKIEVLEDDVNSLNTQIDAQIRADRHPMRVSIDRIETEKGNTEKEIESIEAIVRNIQEFVDSCQQEIISLEDSLKLPERKSVDLTAMEKHVHEFVSGWRRFIIGQETELTEERLEEIGRVKEIADQTLRDYKSSLA